MVDEFIEGKVTESGNPVEDAIVAAVRQQDVSDLSQSQATEVAALMKRTDANGEYKFEEGELFLNANNYHVVAHKDAGTQRRGVENYAYVEAAGDPVPDSGLEHQYDVQEQASVDPLVDQQASNDLTAMDSPTLQSGDINGFDSINTDGADDMYVGGAVPTGPNGEYTVAWVGRHTTGGQFDYSYANGDLGVSGYTFGVAGSTEWVIAHTGGDIRVSGIDGNLHRFIITYDGTDSYLEIDGALAGSGTNNAPTNPQGSLSIGGDWVDNTFREIDFGEFLFYSEFKNSTGRSEIDNYLSDKWGF